MFFKQVKKSLLVFFNWALFLFPVQYMQVNVLNFCKLDWEENLFDFYVESIAFRIKILINVTSINSSSLFNSNMKIDTNLDQTDSQLSSKNVWSKVWFARAIYHTSKSFSTGVGVCTCISTSLL